MNHCPRCGCGLVECERGYLCPECGYVEEAE